MNKKGLKSLKITATTGVKKLNQAKSMIEIKRECKELMPKGMRKREARAMAKIFNKCNTVKRKSNKARQDAVRSQKLLTQHLKGINDFVDDHINVVNLG